MSYRLRVMPRPAAFMNVYPNAKISIIAKFSLEISQILYWELILAWTDVWPQSHGWTESNKYTDVCLTTFKKSFSYISSILRYSWFIALNQFWHVWTHLLEMTEYIFSFNGCLATCKKQLHNSTHFWDEADSLLGITLGMARCSWTHPVRMASSICCLYISLIRTKIQLYISTRFWDIVV